MDAEIPLERVEAIREVSRRLVRELGFMRSTLAGTRLGPSAVHALIEIGGQGSLTAKELGERLNLEKSSVSRMIAKLVAGDELAEGAGIGDRREKPLSLTRKGQDTLTLVDGFARDQVRSALAKLPGDRQERVRDGLATYAAALRSCRIDATSPIQQPSREIEMGYRPGLLGRAVEMHGRIYARIAGFGAVFESKVAAGLAEFATRLESPANGLWSVSDEGRVIAMVAVDGEDLGGGRAHLRWFIVDDGFRGAGLGHSLLEAAVAFCDSRGFAETHLWTFRGLDAARRLYEGHGFRLVEENLGAQWGAEVMEQRFVRGHSSALVGNGPARSQASADSMGPSDPDLDR